MNGAQTHHHQNKKTITKTKTHTESRIPKRMSTKIRRTSEDDKAWHDDSRMTQ